VFHRIIREEIAGKKITYDIESTIKNQIKISSKDETILFLDEELPEKTKKIFNSIKNAGK
jgi:hypothetical protein